MFRGVERGGGGGGGGEGERKGEGSQVYSWEFPFRETVSGVWLRGLA